MNTCPNMVLGIAVAAGCACLAPGRLEAGAPTPNERVLFLMTEGFNTHEFIVPFETLRVMGYKIDIAGPQKGLLQQGKGGKPDAVVNLTLEEAELANYLGLVIPGGFSPGNLEKHPKALDICREFMRAGKPVGAVCHGPRLLMRAGLLKGRTITALFKMADELADPWTTREYGSYLDRPAVVDGNLVTAPHYCFLNEFMREFLPVCADAGGIRPPRGPALALVVGPDMSGHAEWATKEISRIVDVAVTRASMGKLASLSDDTKAYDLIAVLDGKGVEALKASAEFKKVAEAHQARKKPFLAFGATQALLKEMGFEALKGEAAEGEYVPAIAAIIQSAAKAAAANPPPEVAQPAHGAALMLKPDFDEAIVAAVRCALGLMGRTVAVNGPRAGWVHGKNGEPVYCDNTTPGVAGAVTDMGGNVSLAGADGAECKKWADAAVAPAAKAAEYNAAIALREGFDGEAYAALKAYLAVNGRRTIVIGPKAGELRGINGMRAQVQDTYEGKFALAKDALIVVPGGLWPEKAEVRQAVQPAWIEDQAKRDQTRLTWLVDRYSNGATLIVVGLDGLRLGRAAAFKGMKFCVSGQAAGNFGKEGGSGSSEPALEGGPRLYTARDAAALPVLLRLLK